MKRLIAALGLALLVSGVLVAGVGAGAIASSSLPRRGPVTTSGPAMTATPVHMAAPPTSIETTKGLRPAAVSRAESPASDQGGTADATAGGTEAPTLLAFAEGTASGDITIIDLEGTIRASIPVARPAWMFSISDDGSMIAYLAGTSPPGTSEVWVHDIASGSDSYQFTQSWVQEVKWLPGSNTIFLVNASDGLHAWNTTTATNTIWQSGDTISALFGRRSYRSGIAFDDAATTGLFRAGIDGDRKSVV